MPKNMVAIKLKTPSSLCIAIIYAPNVEAHRTADSEAGRHSGGVYCGRKAQKNPHSGLPRRTNQTKESMAIDIPGARIDVEIV